MRLRIKDYFQFSLVGIGALELEAPAEFPGHCQKDEAEVKQLGLE